MNMQAQTRKGRKFDQVINGARNIFLSQGFEGASVDVIARQAGVSKATLYSYFPDKQALFMAVLNQECDLQRRAQMDIEFLQRDVRDALHHLAYSMLEFLMSDEGVSIFRVCVAEAQRFPELGRAFYETGPSTAMSHVAGYFSTPKVGNILDIDDPMKAADLFMKLCRGDLMLRRLLCVSSEATHEEVSEAADEVVATFIARYRKA